MNTKKRYFLILMAFAILCTSILPVSVTAQTTNEKADVLNKVSILAGSTGNYSLSDNLLRAHAAAFIVRLIGEEGHVNANEDIYKITSFPDVEPTEWYARYVGYCAKNGIIVGSATGKFNPQNNISEKAFLRLVLSALGYVYNVDYPLEEVYKKAYSLGLVTDLSYITKTLDNTNYTRGQAIEVLYNALRIINKDTGKEMFYNLLDKEVITRKIAVEAGLIIDSTATAIEEIYALDYNKVYIKFNEVIKYISTDDIVLYAYEDPDNKIECTVDTFNGYELVLNALNRDSDNLYNIRISNLEDENGNITDDVVGMFTGYDLKIKDIESDYFRIKNIEAVNEKAIKIIFTHPINVNSELARHYRIYEDNSLFTGGMSGDITVRTSSGSDEVLLTLNNKVFKQNAVYTLQIDGDITSAYGVKLNDGSGDNLKFTASSETAEPFALEQIIPFDSKTLLLDFNKEINPFLAAQIFNFYITNEKGAPVKIEKTVIDRVIGDIGRSLFISIEGTFVKKGSYSLTINNLSDVTRQEYITEKAYTFTADYGSKLALDIDDVNVIDNKTLEVSFAIPPDPTAAVNANYYTIRGDRFSYTATPIKVFYDANIDANKVRLYLSDSNKLSGNRGYYLNVDSKMLDCIGNAVGKTLKEEFGGTSVIAEAPKIEDAVTISGDAVKLIFDREIALDSPNILTNNYVLEYSISGLQYKKVPLSVIYINAKTLILKFDSLGDSDTDYIINYVRIKDYNGSEGTQGSAPVRPGNNP